MIKNSGASGVFNRPVALMCYICGREYGTKSLSIHLKTCQQKWEIEEAKKPRAQRRPIPLPPVGLNEMLSKGTIGANDIQGFNEDAYTKYNTEALVRCPNCNRTFKPEALVHHQKACTKANPFKPLPGAPSMQPQSGPSEYEENDAASLQPCSFCKRKFAADRLAKHESVCPNADKSKAVMSTPQKLGELKKSTGGSIRSDTTLSSSSQSTTSSYSSPMKQPLRPKTLMCFICGREYGTKSLKIHIKSCEEKWLVDQVKVLKKDRRPLPQVPEGLMELLDKDEITFEDLEQYNNRAYNSYKYTALNKCKNCSRTFTTEALVHHVKVCTPENPFKPLNKPSGDSQEQPDGGSEEELLPCGKCGRKFAPDRVSKHETICKGTGGTGISATSSASKTILKGAATAPITKKIAPPPAPAVKEILRPKTLMCFICGREFGTTSLSIHLKSCEQKWHNDQAKLPPKERRPLPTPPPSLSAMLKGEMTSDDLGDYNQKAYDTYKTDALLTCKFCNRTFTESALSHHSKVCTAEKPFKPINKPQTQAPALESSSFSGSAAGKGAYKQADIPEQGELDLVECSKCGRNFNSDRVTKHEKVCKGPTEKKVVVAPPQTEKPTKKGDPLWKKQHEEFIQSMQYMKKIKAVEESGGDIRSVGPPPKANTDNLVQCPYCNRKFAQQSADRHIPSCKNVINKPKSVAESAPKTFSQTKTTATGFKQSIQGASNTKFAK